MTAPRFFVRDIALFERPVRFTAPFRFGAVTVTEAPQAFVRVEIELEGGGAGRRAVGGTAELMVPKWFDKRPHLTPERTVDELRRSLTIARDLYLSDASRPDTAFGLHASRIGAQVAACGREDIPPLAAAFGPAEIDKAVLDALLRALGLDVFAGVRGNLAGLDARLTPDLNSTAIERFLDGRTEPLRRVAVRHTVGMADEIDGPAGLAGVAAQTGIRYFKLKLCGDSDADRARLAAIGSVLDRIDGDVRVTLDANEQYGDASTLAALLDALVKDAALAPIARRLLYLEQPMPREATRATPLGPAVATRWDVIIDEADDDYGAFPAARALGYRGVSSKSCKGLYKSVLNAVRAAIWNADPDTRGSRPYFIAAEDLTCQAGLGVQQDTALVAFLGIAHAERNGHHYGDGFGIAPPDEAEAFRTAHPDLYSPGRDGRIRLAIRDGRLSTGSLFTPGFAAGAHPRWTDLDALGSVAREFSKECRAS
jgi:hypothetical protein